MRVRVVLVTLLLLMTSLPAAAATVVFQSVETECGVPVTLPVIIQNRPQNLRSITWRLDFDPAKLHFVAFEIDPNGVMPEFRVETQTLAPGSIRINVIAGGPDSLLDGSFGTAGFLLATPASRAVNVNVQDVQFAKGFQGSLEPGAGRSATITPSCSADGRGRPEVLRYAPLAGSTDGGGFGDGQGSSARFIAPTGVARVGDDIFITDSGAHTVRRMTADGSVTTWAGAAGMSGSEDGVGGAARFNQPEGILAMPDGSLLVADRGNNKIRHIAPDRTVTVWAGAGIPGHRDGTRLQSEFTAPSALAIEPGGSVLVADPGSCTVRRVNGNSVTTIAGIPNTCGLKNGQISVSTFDGMSAILSHPTLGILIADDKNHVVRRIVAEQSVLTYAGVAGESGTTDGILGAARLSRPRGLAVMADQSLLIGTANGIRRTRGNVIETIAGASSSGWADGNGPSARLNGVAGVVVSGQTVYAADQGNTAIRRVSETFDVTTPAGSVNLGGFRDDAGPAARFNRPWQVSADVDGNVYVADRDNRCIRRVTPAGIVSVWAGKPGVSGGANGPRLEATFDDPAGLVVDPTGNIWISEPATHVLRMIRPSGVVETVAGMKGKPGFLDDRGADARFNFPMQLATDDKGNIYVADKGNNAIRRISTTFRVVTIAGFDGTAGSNDGRIEGAKFNGPVAVAVSPSGRIIVSDKGNHAIREIKNGSVSTLLSLKELEGQADGPSLGGQLLGPEGVVALPDETFLVAEPNGRIRWITGSFISTLAGRFQLKGNQTGLGADTLFAAPVAVALVGDRTFVVSDSENDGLVRATRCPDDALCLGETRFDVTLRATDPRTGNGAEGLPIAENDLFGFFSLPGLTGNPANPEVFVKVLDGTGVNGKYWVFYGGLTDFELDLEVYDRSSGSTKSYEKPGFDFCGGADTGAFGKGVEALRIQNVTASAVSPAAELESCGASSLCLRSGRFSVELSAKDPRSGVVAAGVPIPRTGDFGYFSLPGLTGNAANPEVFVKVLDGRGVNGRYWVFYGGLTDFEFTLDVTDSESGATRTYMKPGLEFCGGADTNAF